VSARRRSLIAGANAWFRARESTRPAEERLLHDPWANLLAERDPRVLLVRGLRRLVPALGTSIRDLAVAHCVRHRALDQLVLAAVARDGFRQVVVVGAGYDTRPLRFQEALAGVRWIEVDDPETQRRKRRRLAAPGERPPIEYAAVDLERESVTAALARAHLHPGLRTCYVLEGLVHYLSARALDSLLRGLGQAGPPSRILLSFIDAQMRPRATPTVMALFELMGERPRQLLETPRLTSLLARHGYSDLRLWGFAEQLRDFVPEAVRARRSLAPRWWQTVAQAESLPPKVC
jgi:methyltransferase (TIGR00027 family)